MSTIRVFDPAMCCSTGICGPAIDPQLARFAADLSWLKARVCRLNALTSSAPKKHKQMPGEQVHAPLPANNAAQAVVSTAKIDGLDREIDPNARWQREQGLPQPADYGGDVRGIAALLETKPKADAELELDLLGSSRLHAPATAPEP